jgi:hypothetical protein
MHECPAEGCNAHVTDSMLACGRHWRLVPQDLQRRVYRAWRCGTGAGTAAHIAAITDAVAAMNATLRARREANAAGGTIPLL